jgi:hypothetical protein
VDIRVYFKKLQEVEQSISEPWVVVVSQETGNGGKPGILSEVNRQVAARLVVGGKARFATVAEIEAFKAAQEQQRAAAEHASLAGRVQLAVLSEQELRALKSSLRPQKG